MIDGNVLKLHTLPPGNEFNLEIGDEFEILAVEDGDIITDIDGYLMAFTVEPDEQGQSYKDWFNVITV